MFTNADRQPFGVTQKWLCSESAAAFLRNNSQEGYLIQFTAITVDQAEQERPPAKSASCSMALANNNPPEMLTVCH